MSRFHTGLRIIAATFALTAGTARADDFEPAPALGTMQLDLDTQNANLSSWEMSDIGDIDSLHAVLRICRLGEDTQWVPTFAIHLLRNDEQLRFMIVRLSSDKQLEIHVIHTNKTKVLEDHEFSEAAALNEDISLAISWTAIGRVIVKLGTHEAFSTSLQGPPTALAVTSSTGEMKLLPLQLGHTVVPPASNLSAESR